ncbi:MAG TPA: Zn-ribbon domain-containing OB-fold protein [Syntrophales bacterium]|nr:Zn-ribbon domain-containing OB-fold protein [Syntrophales bacterium]HOM07541.1 Zn-ribbon domain-containing OB-fold protein [Syntrophales bacterium]HOO00107.1 Zn-ribbon domain-containing OB-fold protein [Syntrophales bacterium]
MEKNGTPVERLEITFKHPMPYEWSIGRYGSRFFQEIREKRRFIGIRCDGCGSVYVPPRRVCGPCFRELTELVPLSDTGVLTAFSVVNYPFIDPATGELRPIPYTYGYIRLDGADNIFSHLINEKDWHKIKVGMRVRAVFKNPEEMEGNIQDIKYFDLLP